MLTMRLGDIILMWPCQRTIRGRLTVISSEQGMFTVYFSQCVKIDNAYKETLFCGSIFQRKLFLGLPNLCNNSSFAITGSADVAFWRKITPELFSQLSLTPMEAKPARK